MNQQMHTFSGQAATDEFLHLLARAFEEDATGGVVGYDWRNGLMTTERITSADNVHLVKGRNAYTFPLVIVDSGNSSGDSWKYVYHPETESGMFCLEN